MVLLNHIQPMNFKALALTALAASTLTFGGIAPSFAAPSTCAYREGRGSVSQASCDVHSRRNANGHIVHDITLMKDGRTMRLTAVLWLNQDRTPDYAELIAEDGSRISAPFFYAKNGAIGITENGKTFYFSA